MVPVSINIFCFRNYKEIVMLQYEPPNRLYRKDLSFYDKDGRLSYTKSYIEGGLFCENQFQYDRERRNTRMVDINYEFGMKTIYHYIYDDKDLLRETKEYDEKGKLRGSTIFTYNEKGQKIKEERVFGGDIVTYNTFEYDKTGNLICTKRYHSALEEVETRGYKYFKHGHKVFVNNVKYECDCTGVRVIPDGYVVYECQYYSRTK